LKNVIQNGKACNFIVFLREGCLSPFLSFFNGYR
jgi:hypothetical protein